jgi:hypothetical protein
MFSSISPTVRKLTIPAALSLALAAALVTASAATAATYVGGKSGYHVKMSGRQGTLRLPKAQVSHGGPGPAWEVDCGKSPKRRTLMFAVVPITPGQRALHAPLAHSPKKLRSCVVRRDRHIVAAFRTHPR